MQLFPGELALACLKGEISEDERGFATREEALEILRELSGLDFGDDVSAWEQWVNKKYEHIRKNFPPRD